jgi:hypothetical protein
MPVVTASHPHLVAFEAAVAKGMSEKVWAAHVRSLLTVAGFQLVYSTWNSLHSPKGWPDVVAIRRESPGFTVVIAELKTERGKTTAAQDQWLDAWGAIAATMNGLSQTVRVVVGVFRPRDKEELWRLLTEKRP